MSTTASTITAAMKTIVASEIGVGATELAYGIEVGNNKFGGGTKGYSVYPGPLDETEGVNRHVTIDHEFELVLTETFGQAQTGDAAQRAASITLHGRLQDVYRRLIINKAGVPGTVLLVSQLKAKATEYLDANVAVLRATVIIKYRTAL